MAGMNNGQITVDVGVKLQVLQSSIGEIQKVLDRLKPDSSRFKELSTIIAAARKEMERLQLQTSKPFGNQSQFNQAGKTIDKIEESLGRAQLAIDKIKFSDIKLDASQQQQFDGFVNQINQAKQAFEDFKEEEKQGLFRNDDFAQFADKIDPKLIEKNFDQVVTAVENKVQQIDKAIIKSQSSIQRYENQIKVGSAVENFVKGKGFSENTLSDNFNKIFTQTQKGLRFKAGGSSLLFEYLKEQFQLTPGQLKELQDAKTAKAIEALVFEKDFWAPQLKKATQANGKILDERNDLQVNKQNQEEAARANQHLAESQRNVGVAARDMNAEVEAGTTGINNFQTAATKSVTASEDLARGLATGNTQLQQFRDQLEQTNTQFLTLQRQQATFNSMKSAIVNFMGFNQVLNLTKRAVREAANHIKQLDATMNGISIVTNMTTADLWNQVGAYSEMAQKYGTTIQGAYDVSKIYYQQGLETKDVLTLTEETLKLSKVSGLDYAKSTDYMTTALRGFKMEMQEASTVVDVYSNLAANTAVSQEELAVAMSKTASSMESVGSTFEDTSAMIATMVAVTRESATNIGSAMKSIASRYGELTKDPTKLLDSEGEAMSFNKVDAALKSVGISMQTTDHQFRDFTDVIVELSEKWDTLDSTQQRYIATQFAGNRQQSRFLALVSNSDLLKENMETAANSEDIGTLQALKALDSLETKLNQVQVAYQQFYTTIGIESVWKSALDGIRNYIDTLNNLPKLFDKIPLGAIAMVSNLIMLLKNILLKGLSTLAKTWTDILNNSLSNQEPVQKANELGQNISDAISKGFESKQGSLESTITGGVTQAVAAAGGTLLNQNAAQFNLQSASNQAMGIIAPALKGSNFNEQDLKDFFTFNKETLNGSTKEMQDAFLDTIIQMEAAGVQFSDGMLDQLFTIGDGIRAGIQVPVAEASQQTSSWLSGIAQKGSMAAKTFSNIGMVLTTIGGLISTVSREGQKVSGIVTGIGGAFITATSAARVLSGDVSALPQLLNGVLNILNGVSLFIETDAEKLERLTKEAENLNNEAKKAKAEYNTLQRSIDKIDELKEKRYESVEAAEEYQTAVDELAESFPELIQGFDSAGNVMIDARAAEDALTAARQKTLQATYEAVEAEQTAQHQALENAKANIKNLNNSYIQSEVSAVNLLGGKKAPEVENILTLINKTLGSSYGGLYQQLDSGKISINDLLSENGLNKILSQYSAANYGALNPNVHIGDLDELIAYAKESEVNDTNLYDLLDALKEINNAPEKITKTNLEIIDDFVKDLDNLDFTTETGQQRYNEFLKAYKALGLQTEEEKEYFNETIINYNELTKGIDEIITANKIDKGLSRSLVSNWLNLDKSLEEGWEFINDNSQAALLLTNSLYNVWASSEKSWEDIKSDEEFKAVLEAYQAAYNGLDNEQKEKLKNIENDTRSYTARDVKLLLGLEESSYNEYIDEYFSTGVDEFNRLNNIFNQAAKDAQKAQADTTALHDLLNFTKTIYKRIDFSDEAVDFIGAQVNQINELSKQGYLTAAQTLEENTKQLLLLLYKDATSPEDRNLGIDILNNANLRTKEGIDEAIQSIQNSKMDPTRAKELVDNLLIQKQAIIDNIALSIQSDLSSILDQAETDTKTLVKARSGMNVKEANELINLVNSWGGETSLSLSDFASDGTKLILAEQAFKNIQNDYNDYLSKRQEEIKQDVLKAKQLDLIDEQGQFKYDYTGIVYKNLKDTTQQFLKEQGFDSTAEGILNEAGQITAEGQAAIKQIFTNIQNSLDEAGISIDLLQTMVFQDENWKLGDYSSLQQSLEQLGITLEELGSIDLKLDRDQIELRAGQKSLNDAYNSLVSDVLDKGFKNINLADYEGLIANQIINISGTSKTAYQDFVKRYASLAGKSIEETNALLVQAIEKDAQITTGAAADVVKNIKWTSLEGKGYASLKDAQALADALGVSIDNILGQYNKQLDAYFVDFSNIEGIDLSAIDGFSDTVKDAINAFLKEIFENVNKAITGKLSNADITTLTGQLEALGIDNITLDFTKTIDGLKLSQNSAIALYNELKKIDALQAQLAFDELSKSLQKNNENYSDISTTLKRIADLQNMISELKPGDARLKMYQDELAVAQEIARTRSSTDNKDFDFMNRSLANGMQNPIDYWDATGEAYKAMNEAATSGYMEIQDFYNIVNEMNNMADVSGQTLEFMGQTLSGKAEDAAALIEAGMSALSNVKGDGVKIALKNLGADFDIGAADMTGDFDKGIKEMAKSQIKMLDAAINMLEAIVAMQEIGDIDTDGNGIEFGELFSFDEENKVWEYTDRAQTAIDTILKAAEENEELKRVLDSFYLGGYSLYELMVNKGDALTKIGSEGRQALLKAFNVINELATADDWEIGNLEQIYKKLEESGLQDLLSEHIYNEKAGFSFVITPDFQTEIDWNNSDIERRLKEAGFESEEKAREMLDTLARGEGEPINYVQALILSGEIKILDENKYSYHGEEFEGANAKQQIAKIIEKEQVLGAELSSVEGDTTTFTKTIGLQKVTIVEGADGTTTYKFEDGIEVQAADEETALHLYANKIREQHIALIDLDDEEILERRNLRLKSVTNVNFSSSDDKAIQEQAVEIRKHSVTKINEALEEGTEKDGTFTIILGGKDITFDGNLGDMKGKGQEIADKAAEALGIDAALSKTIADAISQAFSGDAGAQIGAAIATGLATAFGETDEQGIPLNNITINPTGIVIKVSEGTNASIEMPEEGFPIDSVNVAATNVILSQQNETDSSGLDIPTEIPEDILKIIYSSLKLIDSGELPDESGVYIPQYLTQHPEITALLSLIILKSLDGTTEYDDSNVNSPSDNLDKKLTAAAILAKIALSSNENTKFLAGTITIGEGQELKISQVLEAIATGNIKINSPADGSSITEGSISIKAGEEEITLPSTQFFAIIDEISGQLGESYSGIDTTNITIPEEIIVGKSKGIVELDLELRDFNDLNTGDQIYRIFNSDLNMPFKAISSQIDATELSNYIDNLVRMVQEGQALSEIDYSNLQKLSSNENLDEALNLTDEQVDAIVTAASNAKLASEDLTGTTENVSTASEEIATSSDKLSTVVNDLSGLTSTGLEEIATTLGTIADNAVRLQGISWDTIADGLTKLLGVTAQQPNTPIIPNAGITALAGITEVLKGLKIESIDAKDAVINTDAPTINATSNVTINAGNVTLNGNLTTNDNGGSQKNTGVDSGASSNVASASTSVAPVTMDTSAVQLAINDVSAVFNSSLIPALQGIPDKSGELSKIATAIGNIPNKASEIQQLAVAIGKLKNKEVKVTVTPPSGSINISAVVKVDVIPTNAVVKGIKPVGPGSSEKNPKEFSVPIRGYGKAKGSGVALASGRKKTLMGELGPELVVSNGRYFLVGQNGAEFVDLAADAIVFNHLQTKKLLQNGKASRGSAVTNEKNAVSFATGNVEGPALASASAALAALKQIRAMWQSMLDASAKDLGSQAGRGSGSGSNGSSGSGEDVVPKNVTAEIERWYNLLRQIAKIEQDITYEEQLQAKIESDRIANGKARYASYKRELELLDGEIVRNKELSALQKSWYDNKRAELAASSYGLVFTYDENGLQQYTGTGKPGSGLGLDILENLTRRNVNGEAIENAKTAQTQLAYLSSIGFKLNDLLYNDDGTKVGSKVTANGIVYNEKGKKLKGQELADAQAALMENFWNNLDGWKEELDGIYDSYHEQLEKVLDNETKRNEILQKIVDNQLSVEQDVVNAIEAREQAVIDELQDQRDKTDKANTAFLKGLNDQLSREREMYQNNQDQQELLKMQRQLSILQRSGGSASQIRSLQEQIDSRQQDEYFNTQQSQIDAIQEASDKQIERLDNQIDLMTEALEYQKDNGLWWSEVTEIMNSTPAAIMDFVQTYTPEYRSRSVTQIAEDLKDLKLRVEEWVGYREDKEKGIDPITGDATHNWDTYKESVTNNDKYSSILNDDVWARVKAEYDKIYSETSDPNKAEESANKILEEELLKSKPAPVTDNNEDKKDDKKDDDVKTPAGTRYKVNTSTGENLVVRKKASLTASKTGKKIKQGATVYGTVKSGNFVYLPAYKGWVWAKALKAYKSGGLITETGPAWLDGSSNKPESILNAEQTAFLRDEILGSKVSLKGLISELQDTYKQLAGYNTYNAMTNNSGVNIENLEMNLKVDSLANDYDAKRAGQMVFGEMVKIARKSGTNSITRR